MGNALASSSQGDGYKALWQKIWQAKVPGKVQVCVWRACQNLLPTRTRLTTKGYEGVVDCITCGHHYEDTMHYSVSALLLRKCITDTILPNPVFKEWMLELVLDKPKVFESVMMIIWALWKNRNSML